MNAPSAKKKIVTLRGSGGVQLQAWLLPAERERIQAYCRRAALPVGEFLRQAALAYLRAEKKER